MTTGDGELAARQLKARLLRAQGMPYWRVAAELHVCKTTAQNYCNPESFKEYRRTHPDPGHNERSRRSQSRLRPKVVAMLSGKCVRCGNTDLQVLQINHINHGGRAESRKYSGFVGMYRAIIKGERSIEDLNVLCANCNTIYEYEEKRINPSKLHIDVIRLLGGKCNTCGIDDIRVLQVNHKEGGGRREYDLYGHPFNLYRAILNGTRSTCGLNVLCANCNRIYEYI